MRHAILVVGSKAQDALPAPTLALTDNEAVRMSTWYANARQDRKARLLDDEPSLLLRVVLAPILAYRFYNLVHNTKLWGGKRPLLLLRGRGLASRLAARAGSWGGGDVVKADLDDERPLGATRFILEADGKLRMRGGS
jgi:hypothetical protein